QRHDEHRYREVPVVGDELEKGLHGTRPHGKDGKMPTLLCRCQPAAQARESLSFRASRPRCARSSKETGCRAHADFAGRSWRTAGGFARRSLLGGRLHLVRWNGLLKRCTMTSWRRWISMAGLAALALWVIWPNPSYSQLKNFNIKPAPTPNYPPQQP